MPNKDDKCKTCGKKMVLICPNEWTLRDEKLFKLGVTSAREGRNAEVKRIIKSIKSQLVKGSASYKVADEIEKRLKVK